MNRSDTEMVGDVDDVSDEEEFTEREGRRDECK